jgi:hypothetical protein
MLRKQVTCAWVIAAGCESPGRPRTGPYGHKHGDRPEKPPKFRKQRVHAPPPRGARIEVLDEARVVRTTLDGGEADSDLISRLNRESRTRPDMPRAPVLRRYKARPASRLIAQSPRNLRQVFRPDARHPAQSHIDQLWCRSALLRSRPSQTSAPLGPQIGSRPHAKWRACNYLLLPNLAQSVISSRADVRSAPEADDRSATRLTRRRSNGIYIVVRKLTVSRNASGTARDAHHHGFFGRSSSQWLGIGDLITEPEGPSISSTVAHHRVDRRWS